jgi:hypothetical protein
MEKIHGVKWADSSYATHFIGIVQNMSSLVVMVQGDISHVSNSFNAKRVV